MARSNILQTSLYQVIEVGIFIKRVHNILHEKLEVTKVCKMGAAIANSRSKAQPKRRFSAVYGAKFNRNPQDFLLRFVTVDETLDSI